MRPLSTPLLVLAALALAGCASPGAADEEGPLVGNRAPAFSVVPVGEDDAVHLADLRGHVVVLDLMGVNCAPCRQEMPHLVEVSRTFADDPGVAMLSIDMGAVFPGLGARNVEELRAFKDEFGATWRFAPDDSGRVGRAYEPISLPTVVVIDAEGVIRAKITSGVIPAERIVQAVRDAKGAP